MDPKIASPLNLHLVHTNAWKETCIKLKKSVRMQREIFIMSTGNGMSDFSM